MKIKKTSIKVPSIELRPDIIEDVIEDYRNGYISMVYRAVSFEAGAGMFGLR